MPARVVLVGLPGTGKTTVGRRLAELWSVPFADTDELVEQRAGRTVPEIFADVGEAGFRRAEADAVVAALEGFPGVLALGGGAVVTDAVRSALALAAHRGVAVVALTATLDTLAGRIGTGAGRPLLAGRTRERLAELAAEREPRYRAVATLTVMTDGCPPDEVADRIRTLLEDRDG